MKAVFDYSISVEYGDKGGEKGGGTIDIDENQLAMVVRDYMLKNNLIKFKNPDKINKKTLKVGVKFVKTKK